MEKDTYLGIVCAVVSAITFGSTYVPLQWFHKGDGLYFQWVQSLGQLLVGVIVALTTTPAPIHPIAMLSGMFYSIGRELSNCLIMDGIGLAIGYLLWNTVTCVVGWAVTRFGLFANPHQYPKSDWLNILGVVTVCVGGAIYAPIKHVPSKVRPAPWSLEEDYNKDSLVTKEVIAYPILSKAPGIIVSLWAIFLFKEIQGKKDIIQLYIGIGVTLLGIAFISLSKVEF
ncbi:Protein CBG21080 [Caenorhabditis briggsae]|uniref:Protein CBG21080 n=1 Tax=Caenorhabditis briggsae TaxID=6238 RepID=A8XZ89_CAEBR|nr:Protein CBG21080 [Caenorhabditis briggsae]CAP37956.2 Protein CBG21080 [Caenorhabditis briggsae]